MRKYPILTSLAFAILLPAVWSGPGDTLRAQEAGAVAFTEKNSGAGSTVRWAPAATGPGLFGKQADGAYRLLGLGSGLAISGGALTVTTTGTVTSVALAGGTTGLTATGGPVTTTGTLTLGGTLALAHGGTGASTAAAARTALGLVIGTDVQGYDADLADLADGTLSGGKIGPGVDAANLTTGIVSPARLGAGSGIESKFLRGDGTWQVLAGGGDALAASPLSQFASTTSAQLAGVLSDETGTGAAVFATSPSLTTPSLGAAMATSINGVTLTPGSGTLTLASGKTLSATATLTLTGTDGSTLNIGTGGTLGSAAYTASTAYQAADADLDDLADGTLSGSKVGTGISASHITSATLDNARLDSAVSLLGQEIALATEVTGVLPKANGGTGDTGIPDAIIIACGDESTPATAGNGKVTFRMPYAATLVGVRLALTIAPTGQAFVVDVNEAGASVLSTKLSVDATEKASATAATPAVISDSALAEDAEITVDFDQVGSTEAGSGAKVTLLLRR